MNLAELSQVVTVGGPVAAIAILAIYINWKIVIRWSDERSATLEAQRQERAQFFEQLLHQMGEVAELLRRLNGRHGVN